jgi:hypothetical protein
MKILKRIDSYALLLFVLVFGISLSVVNISAPLTEGWWHVYARWIDQGRIPYKDFELLVPPGYPYLMWLLTHIVGEQFLHLRILGCLLEAVIALQLFYLFKGLIGKFMAVVLAFFGTIYLYSGSASITYDYHYFAIFFILGAVLFLQKSSFFDTKLFSKSDSRLIVLAGVSVALSSLIKQTYAIAFGLVVVLYLIVRLFYELHRWKIVIKKITCFFLSWLSVLLIVALYFTTQGVFIQMIQQIFFGAAEVKGSTISVAFKWLAGLWEPYWISYNARSVVVLVFACFAFSALSKRRKLFKSSSRFENILLAIVIGVFLLILGLIRSNVVDTKNEIAGEFWQIIRETIFLAPLFVLAYMFYKIRKIDSPWAPMLVLALTFMWGNGMSAGLTEYGTFFSSITAFAFIAASFGMNKIVSIISITSVFISSAVMYGNRLAEPYSWWGYSTPSANEANVTSEIGLTRGLKFSKEGYTEFEEISNRLNSLSCRGEVIGYPHMPIFALDSNRLPEGKVAMYWYDFISPIGLQIELERLKNARIASFVEMPMQRVLEQHIILFENENILLRRQIENLLKARINESQVMNLYSLGVKLSSC